MAEWTVLGTEISAHTGLTRSRNSGNDDDRLP
jgi:hypothetical protein